MADENESGDHEAGAPRPMSSVRQVVWLVRMLKRWQNAAARRSGDPAHQQPLLKLPTPAECVERRISVVVEELEDEPGSEPPTPEALADVPQGCCAVYVGTERRRFVVPTAYLGMPVFRRLLEKAEEEFGFCYHGGALTIPCETEAFKYILKVADRHEKGLVDDEGNPTGSDTDEALDEAGESSGNHEASPEPGNQEKEHSPEPGNQE